MSDSERLFITRINLICHKRLEWCIRISDFQSFIFNVVSFGLVAMVEPDMINKAIEFCEEFEHIRSSEEGNIFLDMKGYP